MYENQHVRYVHGSFRSNLQACHNAPLLQPEDVRLPDKYDAALRTPLGQFFPLGDATQRRSTIPFGLLWGTLAELGASMDEEIPGYMLLTHSFVSSSF